MTRRDGGPYFQAKVGAMDMQDEIEVCREVEDSLMRRGIKGFRELPQGASSHDLKQAGWGVIFSTKEIERGAEEKLSGLLELRKQQAGILYKRWVFDTVGNVRDWLYEELKTSPGTIKPGVVPYYLLMVAAPEEIPFKAQYALSVNHAVGRIYFEELEHYAAYARSVQLAEAAKDMRTRRVDLFAVEKEDEALQQLSDYLVDPLIENLPKRDTGWSLRSSRGNEGTREKLCRLLGGGEETPGVLLVSCHGKSVGAKEPQQEDLQGALVCRDGDVDARALDGLEPASRPLHGMIAWLFCCFGAGTPILEGYPREIVQEESASRDPGVLAKQEFVSRLPQTLLANGALAVLGHVGRGWTLSFRWLHRGHVTESAHSMEDSLVRLLKGARLGHALRPMMRRYCAVTAQLAPMVEAMDIGVRVRLQDLQLHKIAAVDARGHVILGDPAVYALGQPASKVSLPGLPAPPSTARPVLLDPALAFAIRERAEKQGISFQNWVQQALRKGMEAPLDRDRARPPKGRGYRGG